MIYSFRSIKYSVLIAALLSGICSSRLCAVSPPILSGIRTVALSNDSFQGVPSGVVIDQFGYPRVDILGRVGFKAQLLRGPAAVDFNNDTAIWLESEPGTLRYVAREGDPVPGLNYRFNDPDSGEYLRMSNDGSIYFPGGMTSTSSPTTFNSAIFKSSPTSGSQVMVVSSPAGGGIPTTNTDFFSNFLGFNSLGHITMQTGTGFGPIWVLDSVGLSQIAPTGSFPMINDLGDAAYRVIDNNNLRRLEVWNRNPRASRVIARQNQVAPGTGGATFFRMGDESSFTDANGKVSFVGWVVGTNVTEDNDFGVWSETSPGGPLALDLREGQHATGTVAGDVWTGFDQFSLPVTYSRNGTVAMRLGLAGSDVGTTNDSGVWAGKSASQLHLVAREGDQAAGTEPGTLFSQFDMAGTTTDGRGVFQAFLSANGLDPNRDRGIWAEGLDGVLHLVARRGDSVRLPSGEVTQLTSVQFDTQLGVGGLGYVAFISTLANGQRGVFVSSIAAVPEPSSLVQSYLGIVAIATMAGIGRRSNRR
jgi:hypothetical protein